VAAQTNIAVQDIVQEEEVVVYNCSSHFGVVSQSRSCCCRCRSMDAASSRSTPVEVAVAGVSLVGAEEAVEDVV
jgi:hypothetical protein